MPIRGPMLTWCEPMLRGNLKLVPGDIRAGLAWFKETTGRDTRLIVLHPKNERYAKEVPEGIAVEFLGGCLAWEVWLSAADKITKAPDGNLGGEKPQGVVGYTPRIMAIPNPQKNSIAIIKPSVGKVTREKRGPKQKPLPVELIIKWAGEGMGSQAITTRLKNELGIDIGFRTVARVIKGERLLV